jgi:hypothetical protein
MDNTDNTLDTLFNELTSLDALAPPSKPPLQLASKKTKITLDDVEDFVLKSSEELISAGLESISDIKDYIVQGQNPDEIESLASLINSTTNAIEILNKTVLLKKKNEAAKEIKLLDIENRKETHVSNNTTVNNTNVLVASRDEIFKRYLNNPTQPVIPIEDTLLNIELDTDEKNETL